MTPSRPLTIDHVAANAAPRAPEVIAAWRREPYRVLFPLGVLLAWVGVGHWLLLSAFGLGTYDGVAHSITQVQGFMMCFAAGFLMTAIPRRTGTAPPAAWQVALAAAAPIGTTVAAWTGRIALSQALWGALVLVLIAFAVRRFRTAQARRRPPNAFVWVPVAFALGLLGSALTGAGGALGGDAWYLHDVGKTLLLQGMLVGLVLGVGSMVFPLVTCGDAPPDGEARPRDRAERALHLAAAAALAGSFYLESAVDPRLGYALRAAVVLGVLLAAGKIHRTPRLPGWHRWLVWAGAWALPLGYALCAAWPGYEQLGLHVVFVGGFATLALAVGLHVTLAHGGEEQLVRGRPWQVAALAGALLLALVARGLMHLDPARFWTWMAVASALFLLGTLAWLALALPRLQAAR